jgi:hypothetical protein
MNTADTMLPPQAPPIDRTPAGEATFNSQAGVEASFPFLALAPFAIKAISSLL